MGGMGEIYLATLEREAGFEKELVLKRILPTLSDDPSFVQMFNREACVAARLNHQHIVQIFDYGQHQGAYYIAMEYVQGRDLRALLEAARAAGRKLPLEQVWSIVAALGEGLDYAHRRRDEEGRSLGLVHRDVSPQNVLISYEGEIKLTDFGLVQTVDIAAAEPDGVIRGKFAYMSPEQTWGEELDQRSDIFSLGVVAFEAWTGQHPFSAETLAGLLEQLRAVPPDAPPASALRPALPPELDAILACAMSARPEDRYPDVRALLTDLEALARAQGWTRSSGALGALVTELCPPGAASTAPMSACGGTQRSDRPIALLPTAPALLLEPPPLAATVPGLRPVAPLGPAEAQPEAQPAPQPSPFSVVPAGAEVARGRWMPVVAGALVLGMGALAVGVLLIREDAAEGEWTLHIEAVPEDAEVFVNGASQGSAPTSVRSLPGGRPVEITLAHAGYKTRVETLELDDRGGTQRVRAVLEPAEARGGLFLEITPPEARVLADGVALSPEPDAPGRFVLQGGVEPQQVRLRVELEGYQPVDDLLEIPARATRRHAVELRAQRVRVDVRAESEAPGEATIETRDFQTRCGLPCSVRVPYSLQGRAKVTVQLDGAPAPWTSAQPLTPGGHLTFTAPAPRVIRAAEPRLRAVLAEASGGRAVRMAEVTLSRQPAGIHNLLLPDGVQVSLRHQWDAATRQLRVTLGCDPWCQVSLDGVNLGQTPQANITLTPGSHVFRLSNREAALRVVFTP